MAHDFVDHRLSPREAKWVARVQAPSRLGYQRRHRQFIKGILTHQIVRDISVPAGIPGVADGDLITLRGNGPDEITGRPAPLAMQGLFRVKMV